MSKTTLGQVAFQTEFHPSAWSDISQYQRDRWEAAANAVVDRCLEAVDSVDGHYMGNEMGKFRDAIDAALHALKTKPGKTP